MEANTTEYYNGNRRIHSQARKANILGVKKPKNPTKQQRWKHLSESLGYVLKDAVALSRVEQFIEKIGSRSSEGQPQYKYYTAVEDFTALYRDILKDKTPLYLEDLDLNDMETTYSAIWYFTKLYICNQDKFDFGRINRYATSTEIFRVLRAMYRRSIVTRLYYPDATSPECLAITDRQAYMKAFHDRKLGPGHRVRGGWQREDTRVFNGRLLGIFEPWELEQIVAVDHHLIELVHRHVILRRTADKLDFIRDVDEDGQSEMDWVRPFLDSPMIRLVCDIRHLHDGTLALWDYLRRIKIPSPAHIYLRWAPRIFLFDQQALSYRNGYNKLKETKGRLPQYCGDALDEVPLAWLNAFASHSPHCRAFGPALAPSEHKFNCKKHPQDNIEPNITPSDSSSTRDAKLLQTSQLWLSKYAPEIKSYESDGVYKVYDRWIEWCKRGFVMWDSDRVLKLERTRPGPDVTGPRREKEHKFERRWIDADSVLDAMKHARVRRWDGRFHDEAGM